MAFKSDDAMRVSTSSTGTNRIRFEGLRLGAALSALCALPCRTYRPEYTLKVSHTRKRFFQIRASELPARHNHRHPVWHARAMGNLVWKVVATGAAVGASIVARKVTDGTWKFVSGKDSPSNPEDPDIGWGEAVAFAVFSGAVVGLTRMLANRQAAAVYKRSTGSLPKEIAGRQNK